jgi:acyl carrier protein
VTPDGQACRWASAEAAPAPCPRGRPRALDCEQITTLEIFFVHAQNPNVLIIIVAEPVSQMGALDMATVKLAALPLAEAFEESYLHDVHLLIAEHLDTDIRLVTNEAHFIHDLGADYLDRIELMMALEDRFVGVEITDDDIEQFQVVGDLIYHLASQQNANHRRQPGPPTGQTSIERSRYLP